jgi:hypothetical protein
MIRAVIGVWRNESKTFYVKRSDTMTNYPGVWSLPSFQFDLEEGHFDPHWIFNRMSGQRFGGSRVNIGPMLTSGMSNFNPMNEMVTLFLYDIEFIQWPILNHDYYTEWGWLTQAEYEIKTLDAPCGLCTRLWADYYKRYAS